MRTINHRSSRLSQKREQIGNLCKETQLKFLGTIEKVVNYKILPPPPLKVTMVHLMTKVQAKYRTMIMKHSNILKLMIMIIKMILNQLRHKLEKIIMNNMIIIKVKMICNSKVPLRFKVLHKFRIFVNRKFITMLKCKFSKQCVRPFKVKISSRASLYRTATSPRPWMIRVSGNISPCL